MTNHITPAGEGGHTGPPRAATTREWIGLSVLALACLVYVMDLTVLHLALPTLSAELRPTGAQLLWIIDIYGYMVAGFLVTMGTLGDRIGRRKLLMIGSAAFGAVSALTAFASTPETLIICRALLGIAGATLAPSTLSLIFSMFEQPKQRSFAVAVWVSAFSAGSAAGPVFGGILLEHFWWGSVFLLGIPVMVLLLLLGPRVLPEFRDPAAGRLDLISVVLSLGAVLTVIYGVKEIAQAGVSVTALATIAVGVAVGATFVRRQGQLANPMFDLSLFRIPAFRGSLVVNLLAIFAMFGYTFLVAQVLQLVLNLSPFQAGLWSLPSAVAFILASNLVPRLAPRTRPALVLSVSLTVAAIGTALLTLITPANGLIVIVIASILTSIGLAPVFGLTTEMIVGAAPANQAGAASGLAETATELGGALGISVLGSIAVGLYRVEITAAMPPAVPAPIADFARDTLGAAVAAAADLPPATAAAMLNAARTAFLDGVRVTAFISAAVAVLVAIFAFVALRHVPRAGVDDEPSAGERLLSSSDTPATASLSPVAAGPANPGRSRHSAAD